MALHLIMANIPLVLGVLVVLNTLDIDELLDITRLLHLLVVRLCAGLSIPHECFPQLLIHKIVVDTSTELSSELLMKQLLCLLVLRLSRYRADASHKIEVIMIALMWIERLGVLHKLTLSVRKNLTNISLVKVLGL